MTLAQLQQRLGDWLGANAVRLPPSVRTDLLNIAQKELCRQHDMRYNELLDTFDTAVPANAYVLPVSWSRPYELWYIDPDSAGVVFVKFLLLDEFDNLYPDATKTGKPKHYTLWGDSMYLGPSPSITVTMHRAYYGYLPDLANPGDHNALTDLAWEIVLFKALGDTHRYGLEDGRIPVWIARAKELEDQLVREQARGKSVGRRPVGTEPG